MQGFNFHMMKRCDETNQSSPNPNIPTSHMHLFVNSLHLKINIPTVLSICPPLPSPNQVSHSSFFVPKLEMTNGGHNGTSSNPNLTLPNPELITCSGRPNVPPPLPSLPPPRSRALPRQWPPPILGIPGVSAFTPYYQRARPQQPPPQPLPPPQSQPRPHRGRSSARPSGSGSHNNRPGNGSSGFAGFHQAQDVLVGGSGRGNGSGALRIGVNVPALRKRGRDGGPGGIRNQAAWAGEGGGGDHVRCSMCGKEFMSSKALFGHMRSHPERGWKGAHPPPAFRAEEEFADLRPLYQPAETPAVAPQDGEAEASQGDGGGAREEERMEASEGERKADEDGGGREGCRNIPDLNE
ncbi:hypothetical protein OROMI_004745 [Orobanche minor]